MDVARFLNFLNSFATSTSKSLQSNPTGVKDLSGTLSEFERQLRQLTQQLDAANTAPPASALASTAQAAATSPATSLAAPMDAQTGGFVVGGFSDRPLQPVAVPEPTDADRAAFWVNRNDTFVQTRVGGSIVAPVAEETPAPPSVLKEIIAWQAERMDPMMHVKIGDIWQRQGIADPASDPRLLENAQHIYDTAICRKKYFAGYVADWEKDWRSQLAQSSNLPPSSVVAGPNDFVTGGRLG